MAGVFLQTIFDEVRQALESGDTELAIGIAQHILEHAPRLIEAHRLLGEAYLNAAQFAPASEAFQQVLQADPEHIAAYYGLGLAQRGLNRTSDAIHSLERALEIQPNLAELRTQLLQLYAETPNSAGQFRLSRSGLGRLYARGQMFTQAIDEFRAVLDNEPERDDVCVALAEALWRDGQEDAAIEWSRVSIEAKPDLFKPTLILGYLQLAAGEPEGEALWRRAAAQQPSLATAEMLFEVLPPIQVDEPLIPAFDEQAWRTAGIASPVAEPTPDAGSTDADEQFASSPNQSDDDLLASLLGFDFGDFADSTPAADAVPSATQPTTQILDAGDATSEPQRVSVARTYPAAGVDVIDPVGATSSTAAPLDDDGLPGADAQPFPMFGRTRGGATTSFGRVEPFKLDDWDAPSYSTDPAAIPGTASEEPKPSGQESATEESPAQQTPVSEASLPQESLAQTAEDSASDAPSAEHVEPDAAASPPSAQEESISDPYGDIKPFSLDDLDDESPEGQRTSSIFGTDTDEEFHPFSLRELGLDRSESKDEDTQTVSQGPAPSEDGASFSLRELGLARDKAAIASPGEQASTTAPSDTSTGRADLGLTDDELLAWESQIQSDSTPWREPSFYGSSTAQEPITPFSLADLGLSDEELERWSGGSPMPSAGLGAGQDDEITPFSLADFEPPATPPYEAPDPRQMSADQDAVHTAETEPFDVSALLGEAEASDSLDSAEPEETPPAKNPILSRFHQQLAVNPENHSLRLALARANVQQEFMDQAIEQYKQLVKRGVLLQPIEEDVNDLLTTTQDRGTLRRLHRLMGDVYMNQGRMDEALEEYSWT